MTEKVTLVKVNDDRDFEEAVNKALSKINSRKIRAIQIFAVQGEDFVSVRQAVIIYETSSDSQ